MAKKQQNSNGIATTKQTSGTGFTFEDQVVAYYLTWMLSGNSPLGMSSPIDRIDCQVGADGWHKFDDLLITFVQQGQKRRHAFSIKSNAQFTQKSASSEFVKHAWMLFLHEGSDVFNQDLDGMGLICVRQPNPSIHSLLKKSKAQTPEQLASRIHASGYASPEERNLFNSFSCPEELAQKHGIDKSNIGKLLKKIAVIELDFDRDDTSNDQQTANFICRQLLVDGSSKNGSSLWEALCTKAQQIRNGGGGSTREELLRNLRPIFEFRDFPDFSADWGSLRSWAINQVKIILDRIGGSVQIQREEILDDVLESLSKANFISLIGASGTGKTVIGKRVAEEFRRYGEVLWFDAGRLRQGYLEDFSSHHRLNHTFDEVLSNCAHANGLVVIDAGERLLGESDFREAVKLLHVLEMDKPGCIWRVLILCQAEEWKRVQGELIQHFGQPIHWVSIGLRPFSFDDLQPVWQAFPALSKLAVRPHLKNLMLTPKVLDIFAVAIQSGVEFNNRTWVGEWDVIQWYWNRVVRNGEHAIARSNFLQRMAEVEANIGQFEFPEVELLSGEQDLVQNLRDILSNKDNRITFTHDLFADWARLMAIRSHETLLAEYVKDKFRNPHWHKALRLYGVSLLEQDETAKAWEAKLNEIPEIPPFLLEALIFAGNSGQFLANAWTILTANDGKLLRDLLMRFLYVATIPNPNYIEMAKDVGLTEAEARTWDRWPLWMYWLGFLKFLASHKEEVAAIAFIPISQIAYTWLQNVPDNWPGRDDAAALALVVGQLNFRNHHYYDRTDKDIQIPYKALLAAFPDKPDQVRELALKACSRKIPDEMDGKAFEDYKQFAEYSAQEPWVDGPLYRLDHVFQSVCLETAALSSIMKKDPDLAREIILALLIKARRRRERWESNGLGDQLDRYVDLDSDVDAHFSPGFYIRGPFLLFLRINPRHALEMIIRLVNFVTDQWVKSKYKDKADLVGFTLPVSFDGENLLGVPQAPLWYQPFGADSSIIDSALMAVEKWLYDCIDNQDTVDEWITLIFAKSHSIAFIDMLSDVGRYSPNLFVTVLKPLLLVPNTYVPQGGRNPAMAFSFRDGEWFFKLFREWNGMEHRSRRLIDIAIHLFFTDAQLQNELLQAVNEWKKLIDNQNDDMTSYTQQLIAIFDLENWHESDLPDNTKGMVFQLPEHLNIQQTQEENEQRIARNFFISRPHDCQERLKNSTPILGNQIAAYFYDAKMRAHYKLEDLKLKGNYFHPADAICGTIAVMFYFHRQWLAENPKEEAWCINYLKEILKQPPPSSEWGNFVCEVIPLLWADDPNNSEWRMFVAQLITVLHYDALEILVRRAFEKRKLLGKSFWQLVNFVLEWSGIRYQIRKQDQHSQKKINVDTRWKKAVKTFAFVIGQYDDSQVSLLCEKNTNIRPIWRDHQYDPEYQGGQDVKVFCQEPGLDVFCIKAVFENIFLLSNAANSNERAIFLGFWGQILDISLMRSRVYDERGNELDAELVKVGLPTDYDYWVLDKIGAIIIQLSPDEQAEQYWLPVLSLGPRADHWIERFLSTWFLNIKPNSNHDQFLYHWQRMFDFCLSSSVWTNSKGRYSYHLPEMWSRLIGISNFGISFWVDEDKETIQSMSAYFVQAVPHILYHSDEAVRLISWLSKSSASSIRVKILLPLGSEINGMSERWWENPRLITEIARYLNIIWDENRSELNSNSEFRRHFDQLLHLISNKHEPLALELQARISSR